MKAGARLTVFLFPLLLGTAPVHAQFPIELYECTPSCRESEARVVETDCDVILTFEAGEGLSLWGPLANAGPIRIGVLARRPPAPIAQLPLHIRVLGTQGSATCAPTDVGVPVWETLGADSLSCETWLWSPTIDLVDAEIPLGTPYWVQLESQYVAGPSPPQPQGSASSPLRACIVVEAISVRLEGATWSAIKRLFDR